MRILSRSVAVFCLIMVGYVLGASDAFTPVSSLAQENHAGPSKEAQESIKGATASLNSTMALLQQEGAYVPAIVGINSFATTVGGVNAIEDLETGRGVDPETFAGLYANQAVAEVAAHLGKDEEGRVTYKNKVVRMYSVARLKDLFARRVEKAEGIEAKP